MIEKTLMKAYKASKRERGDNIIKPGGNPSVFHTHKWVGIALSDNLKTLKNMAIPPYRIVRLSDLEIIDINKSGLW